MSSAKYGKPSGPLRVTSEKPEVSGYGIVCCGYCSGQMVANFVDPSVSDQMESSNRSAHASRSSSGRPHNNGSNASEVRNGTKAAMGVEMVSADMNAVKSALKAGKAAVYNHEYGVLPDYLRNQSGSFGHSACLAYWSDDNGGMAGWFDPLASQGSQGIWAKWSDLTGAAWGGTAHSVSKKTAPKPPEPEPEPEPEKPPPAPIPVRPFIYDCGPAIVGHDDDTVRDWYHYLKSGDSSIPFPVHDASRMVVDQNPAWDTSAWRQTIWPVPEGAARWDQENWPVTSGGWVS